MTMIGINWDVELPYKLAIPLTSRKIFHSTNVIYKNDKITITGHRSNVVNKSC